MTTVTLDARCDCCKRHTSELKPFGKAGDPLRGDFDGALLVRNFRPDAPPDEEIEEIMEEFFGACCSGEDDDKADEKLIEKYGKKEAERIREYFYMTRSVGSSWECRDCICLSAKRYYRVLCGLYKPDAGV